MGVKVECPSCESRFRIHGYEAVTKCFECNSMFNPQQRVVSELYPPDEYGKYGDHTTR